MSDDWYIDQDEFDSFVLAFERSGPVGGPSDIAAHLPPAGHRLRDRVLRELIRVDMEIGWERGNPNNLEEYLDAFPDLRDDRVGLRQLAFEEDRLRRQAGRTGPGGGETPTAEVEPPPAAPVRVAPDYHVVDGRRDPGGPKRGDACYALIQDPDEPELWAESVYLSSPRWLDQIALSLGCLPEVGEDFLGFRLIGELGRGSFGKVYLARQGGLADRPVAVKISPLLPHESDTLARLQHTNIVPIYSVHRGDRLQAVCMPYFGSATLKDVCDDLGSHGSLPVSGRGLLATLSGRKGEAPPVAPVAPNGAAGEAPGAPEALANTSAPRGLLERIERLTYVEAVVWMASRLVDGLAHAHERGVLHRDLKPANVLLTDDGQPMLLDFNLSADLAAPPGDPGGVGGTLAYMAPEHLDALRGGAVPVDARSDVYSFGIVLYELLTGRRPFDLPDAHADPDALVDRLIAGRLAPPPPVRRWNPAVTPAVESIVRHCLEPDPSDRYRSARELHEDLERHLANLPLRHAPEPSVAERAGKWARRHPTVCGSSSVGFAAVVLLALLGAGSWLVSEEQKNAAARHHYRTFRETFERCQFLLNTYGGPSGNLDRGLSLAREALESYAAVLAGNRDPGPGVRRLPDDERRALREELVELVLLESRARVARARAGGSAEALSAALERAVDRLDLAERVDARAPAALYDDRSAYHAALGHRTEASRDARLSLATPPSSARDHYLQGTARLARGEADRAEALLARATALGPRQFWAWFALGICHSDQGRDADAASDFGVSTTLAPDFAWSHQNRGLALARSGRLPEAIGAYDRALEIDPALGDARVNRGLAALELGDAPAALVDLDRAISVGLGTPQVRAARGEALARLGRHEQAERAFARAIESGPGDPWPWVVRGFARLGRDPVGASADFRRALEIDPGHARAHLGRAHLLREQDPRAALADAESAFRSDPGLIDALELCALIRARLGDPSAEADVERLILAPTPNRLYNGACALAVLSQKAPVPHLVPRALDLLSRALATGFAPDRLADDPDLAPLRRDPNFPRVLSRSPAEDPGASRTH